MPPKASGGCSGVCAAAGTARSTAVRRSRIGRMRAPLAPPKEWPGTALGSRPSVRNDGPGLLRLAELRMGCEPRGVEAVDDEADHCAEGERQRRPHVEVLHRHADEQRAKQGPDDRADAAEAELPAGAVG